MLLLLYKSLFGKRRTKAIADQENQLSLEQKLERIKAGDEQLRNQLIADYKPYIAKITSTFSKRYIEPGRDDEFSIAILAFNEAIEQFSAVSGRSFLSFAETVIRRRLIDYVRKEQRFAKQVPYSSFESVDEDDNLHNPVEIKQSLFEYEDQRQNEMRKQEIMMYTAALQAFGISFVDLVEGSPKHADSRQILLGIARKLTANEVLLAQLMSRRQLPIKELLEITEVSRKMLERNRKFLIAVTLIYNGDYPHLQRYIIVQPDHAGEEGGEDHG